VFHRAYFRKPVHWFIVAAMLGALACMTYNAVVVFRDHGRLSIWFLVGMGLLLASQLTSLATRSARRR